MSSALLSIALLFIATSSALPQSGRRLKVVKVPEPPPVEQPSPAKPAAPPPVTAEKNEQYRCTDDGSLARILERSESDEEIFTTKTVDVKAYISSRPRPQYTREGRRAGVQGYVILRVILQSNGEVGPIEVLRGLPAGLTESAIRAACKIQFKPAIKDRKEVSQSLQIEYGFRLADPSIFGP